LHVLPEFCMNSVESELIGSVFSWSLIWIHSYI
jgi:hypothetical protein